MTEAFLHLCEAEKAQQTMSTRMARSVVLRRRGPESYELSHVELPKVTSLGDLIPDKLSDMHVAGFFRAVGLIFDTLAAVSIGVGAFKLRILTADFRNLLKHLDGQLPSTPSGHLQSAIKEAITRAIGQAGPSGWLDWALDFRNMLVHRGRRLSIYAIDRDQGPFLYDHRNIPVPRARVVMHLPRDPRHSDLQSLFDTSPAPTRLANLLEEDGLRTLRNTISAVIYVVKETSRALLRVWRDRRNSPTILPQPVEQWPDVHIQPAAFPGFAPNPTPIQPDHASMSLNGLRRLAAAAVPTATRHLWNSFTD